MTLQLLLLSAIFLRPVMHPQIASSIMTMEVTAYCGCESCCGEYADGITASGHRLRQGDKLIAAPTAFPFGTIMYIPGYGRSSVKDRGGSIRGSRLDVYFDTHEEALQWGRQKLLVTIFQGE